MNYVYVINNQSGKIYIGQTDNLEERLKRHNGLLPTKISSFTNKNSGPWSVIYKEEVTNRSEALKREKQLKSYQGRQFIKKIISEGR